MGLRVPSPSLAVIFVFFLINQSYYMVEGRRILSEEEDMELERQLKILNKPPVKTIQTEEGDIFDCIDIHKQPTLDHPLLKNHRIQMRPTSRPKVSTARAQSKGKRSTSVFKSFNCPKGTVPIRRTRKEDLMRTTSFLESTYPSSIHEFPPGQYAAGRKSGVNGKHTYYGVQGRINAANPTVASGTQFSSGQIWIEGGPKDHINSLQAGWAVAPQLFGDNKTRFFVYSNSDVQQKPGCYNYQCLGFLHVDEDVGLGAALSPISVYDGPQYEERFAIFQDNVTKHWWLSTGEDPDVKNVGYWPQFWFPNLREGAWGVAWGGLVKVAPKEPGPQMGNGHYSNHNYDRACSVVYMQTVDPTNTWVTPIDMEMGNFANSDCYDVEYMGYESRDQGESFLFGGPGGDNCGS